MTSVRSAVRELAPVVVRRQSTSAIRHESTLDRVVGEGADAALWIHPIDADAFRGNDSVVVHVIDRPLSFAAPVVTQIDRQTISIPLADIRTRRPTRQTPRPYRRWDLLLTAPSGVGDMLVLPVVDIASNYCAVRGREPLLDGHILHSVELVGAAGVLRHCSARVLESIPWVTEQQNREFRIRLALEEATEVEQREYDTVEDPASVRRILELAALLDVAGTIEQSSFRFLAADHDELLIETELPHIGRTRRWLEFELFAIRYECQVRLLQHRANLAQLSYPLFLRRRRRRTETRAVSQDLWVSFRNPVSATRETRQVSDISQGGLRFVCLPEDILWRDLILNNAILRDRNSAALGNLRVRFTDGSECGTAFVDPQAGHREPIGRLLMRLRQPSLDVHDGSRFDRQLKLYRTAKLLMPYMEELLACAPADTARAWRLAHESGDVCRTLARYEDDVAVASVTACMAWNGTWLGEHLAALKSRAGCTPGTLLMAFLDHVLLRPDCRWMAFFATVGNERMNQIHERFAALTGTPDAMARHRIAAWLLREPVISRFATTTTARNLKRRDHVLIERAASRQMGCLVSAGLGFAREGIMLNDVSKRMRRLGLRRERHTRIISTRDTRRVATVTERCSPGLCIPGLLNATWILPLHLEAQGGVRAPSRDAVYAAVADLQLENGEPCRLVLTDESTPREWMRSIGLSPAFEAYVYVMNRAGLRRYAAHLAESYGTLNALRRPRSSANAS